MNGRRLLVASVISVQNSSFVYPSCQNCFSKLFLNLKRYSCLKCGCSGDAKEANYRYRLSLEVADIWDVLEVTVFGSCLDAYFGVTAKGLQRYIEELNQEAGESDRDATPGVVFQAVETCFIGKRFIFGVKDSVKPDDASSLQNDYRIDRYSKALTACQMFIPNPELVGFTVIQFLQEHRCSRSKHSPGSIWPPGLFTAFDQQSSELSSSPGSGDWATVPSNPVDGLSSLWPQSSGLTSSSVPSETTADPVDLNSSQTASEKQKGEDSPFSLHSQSVSNPQDHNLMVNKRNEQEAKKWHLYTTQWNHVTAESEPESYFSLGRKDCRSLQSPLELEEKDSSNKISIRHSYVLEKSWNPWPRQRNDDSLCPLSSSSSHARAGALWDELPSSENLNEFIAKIENDEAMVLPVKANAWEHFPGNGVDEFDGHFDQSSPKPGIFSASFKTGQADEKSWKRAEKVEMGKINILPCHQLNLFSSISNEESHQEAFYSCLSAEGKEKGGDLSSQHPIVLPWSSPAGVKPPHPKESCQSTEGVDQNVRGAKNLHSSSSLKSISNCLEKPCVHTRKTTAHLNCKGNDSLATSEYKGSPCYQLNQTADLRNIQEQGFSSTISEKSGEVCEREREPISEVQEYNSRVSDVSHLLQGYSDCPGRSYNASADLFDVGARGAEATVGMLNSSQAFSVQEGTRTPKCITSEFRPSELDASWNTSRYGLPLCNMFSTSDQKTSTRVAGSVSELEHSLAGTLDFIPNSQSTPFASTCQQVSLPRGKESVLSELPLNKLPWSNAKCKRLRPSLKNPLAKRLVSMFLQSRRSNSANSATTNASDPQQLLINGSPVLELSENDGEEWIPPSEKKWMQPLEKTLRRGRSLLRNHPDSQNTEKFSPENKLRCGIPNCSIRPRRVEFTPKRQQPRVTRIGSQPIHENGANLSQLTNGSPGFCAFADGNRLDLSSTPYPMPDAPDWSPELFSDHC